jgi:hypothetical protein
MGRHGGVGLPGKEGISGCEGHFLRATIMSEVYRVILWSSKDGWRDGIARIRDDDRSEHCEVLALQWTMKLEGFRRKLFFFSSFFFEFFLLGEFHMVQVRSQKKRRCKCV